MKTNHYCILNYLYQFCTHNLKYNKLVTSILMKNISYLTLVIFAIVCGCSSQPVSVSSSTIEGVFLGGDSSHIAILAHGADSLDIALSSPVDDNEYFISGDSIAVKCDSDGAGAHDVILLSRQSAITNIALMFVGTWFHPERAVAVTFNLDQTAVSDDGLVSGRWAVSGRKLSVVDDKTADNVHEYDIVRIDKTTLTLCYEDSTIRLCRLLRNPISFVSRR